MGVPQEDKIVRGCIELMFNVMLEEGRGAVIKNPLQKNTFTSEKTIEWITPRYDALKKYAPDFFKNHPDADMDAVTVALLCTGFTHMAHVPKDNHGDTSAATVFTNDTIPWDVIERAEDLIDEAEKMAQRVYGSRDLPEEGAIEEPRIETVFLAHAFLGDTLYQICAHDDFEYCSQQDLEYLRNETLMPIRNFVLAYTLWGKDLIEYVAQFERYIELSTDPAFDKAPEQTEPVKERPQLTLINCQPSNP